MNGGTIAGLVLSSLILSGSVLVSPAAYADRGWKDRGHTHRSSRHGEYDYARVIDVDPIIRRVRVSVPREQCFQDTVYEQADVYEPTGYRDGSRGSAGPMILGGLIGAAVGNQIGSGDGRRAATVAGALIGTAVGHDVGHRRDDRRHVRAVNVPRTIERCETTYVDDYEDRVEGYDVTYVYEGRRMTTRMPYDPGDRVRVRVDIYPAE